MPKTLFADILHQELDLRIKVTGRSMRPFINNGDIVTLRKVPPESLQCGDIIYFTSINESSVLHRIISKTVRPNNNFSFITKGDALLQQDTPITKHQVLGKVFYVEKKLPLLGPVSIPLESFLSKILSSVFQLIISIKHSAGRQLKLACSFFLSK